MPPTLLGAVPDEDSSPDKDGAVLVPQSSRHSSPVGRKLQ